MAFLNETGIIATGIQAATNDFTGNYFLTLFLIWVFFIFIGFIFRMGLMEISILLAPLTVVLMAYNGEWYAAGGLLLVMLAVFLARNWFVQER